MQRAMTENSRFTQWVGWLLSSIALACLGVAAAVLLWPLHANGVSGSALRPHYRDFGFATDQSVPENPTFDDLRRAGIRLPQDVVSHRRHIAELVGVLGVVVVVTGSVSTLITRRGHSRP